MSGHSKWNNIKRRKEATDGAKAKIFTKIGREMSVAVKEGGPDPSANFKLAAVIAKAKANNVPNDNIERIIKKASGEDGGNSFEVIVYEGYGPGGVAVIIETLTDNKNRTAADVRHALDKNGGNLGSPGCVGFLFQQKGVLLIDGEVDFDTLMEDAIEAGAEDIEDTDGDIIVYTAPSDFDGVLKALSEKYKFSQAEVAMLPTTKTALSDEDHIKKMERLQDMLDDNDDVQNYWTNWDE